MQMAAAVALATPLDAALSGPAAIAAAIALPISCGSNMKSKGWQAGTVCRESIGLAANMQAASLGKVARSDRM